MALRNQVTCFISTAVYDERLSLMSVSAEYVPLKNYSRMDDAKMLEAVDRFHDKMKTRRSLRMFSSEPVPKMVVEKALLAAGTAPSGANHQPWHFCAISDPATKRKIRLAAEAEEREFYSGKASDEWLEALEPLGTDDHKPFLEEAPWLIPVFAQRRGGERSDQDKKNYYVTESVGLATGMLITALHMAGLATLTHTPAPMGFLNEICGRPKSEKPFVLLVVGHPAENAEVPAHALIKKSLNEISSFI